MASAQSETRAFDAFKMSVTDIRDVELGQLHAHSIAVGWPHRAEDWQALRDVGQGLVALDDIGRVLGSIMWFPHGEDFATLGMMITSPRLQALGAGEWLMKQALAKSGCHHFRLSATRAGRRLYLSLDFIPGETVYQCQAEARWPGEAPPLPDRALMRRLDNSDLAAVIALDARGFGVPRPVLLASLFPASAGYGLFRDDRLEAFALCRRFGRGSVIGPVVATDDHDAIAVVAPQIADHAGHFVRLDTSRAEGEFFTFLAQVNLPVFDTVLSMSRGDVPRDPAAPKAGQPVTYALASQALG
ncbi:MAG: GNAT family N-acetyltransferase [Azospirillaceae bacterium]|nr:GNAT family N-acetyltransferase [Azospirillaceae bacterium]